MVGKATIHIPASNNIGETTVVGLSDDVAIGIGRIAAMTLSDDNHIPVTVTLENGLVLLIGYDLITDRIVIGRDGYREYAGEWGSGVL